MTDHWEIVTKNEYFSVTQPHRIIEIIKEGLTKGEVTVNGKKVAIVQRNGQDAWIYVE